MINTLNKAILLLLFSVTNIVSCSDGAFEITRPNDFYKGMEEVFYLNSFSNYCKKYEYFNIALHKDFSAELDYKIKGSDKKTFETTYSYVLDGFFDDNFITINFDNYLPIATSLSPIDYSINNEIVLSDGYCMIDFDDNAFKYSRDFDFGGATNANGPIHAYFSKKKKHTTDYFSIKKEYQLVSQLIPDADQKFEYFTISLTKRQKCLLTFKVKDGKEKIVKIKYEYLEKIGSTNIESINLLDDVSTDFFTLFGGLRIYDDELSYVYDSRGGGTSPNGDNQPRNHIIKLIFTEKK